VSSLERLGGTVAPVSTSPTVASLRGRRYGEDRLHLLTRDPRRVFATWEISAPLAARAAAIAAAAGVATRYQLRVERAANPDGPVRETLTRDLPDAWNGEAWYVDLPSSGGVARALLGIELPGGFEVLLFSRWTPVPPDGPCAEAGTWPLDAAASAWLEREAARQRAASGARMPSSATRYLTATPPDKP